METEFLRSELNKMIAKHSAALELKKRLADDVERLKKRTRTTAKAIVVAQEVAKSVQHKAHVQIAGVVTRCLAAVFPNPYEFRIIFESKRGKTEARMVFVRDGKELSPSDGVGGSVLDVASFALRLACLGLQKPKRRRVVFIDEGFVGVSSLQENKERLRTLLSTLADELKFQVIMVTHDEGLRAGKVISV